MSPRRWALAGWALLALLLAFALTPAADAGAGYTPPPPQAATTTTAGLSKLRPFTIGPFLSGVALAVTNLPAATTELAGTATRRAFADTTNATQVMLVWQGMGTAPSAGTHGGVQCSADQVTWFFTDNSADGDLGAEEPRVTQVLNQIVWSAWKDLGSSCIGERVWRVVTDDGDGVADPVVGTVYLLAR